MGRLMAQAACLPFPKAPCPLVSIICARLVLNLLVDVQDESVLGRNRYTRRRENVKDISTSVVDVIDLCSGLLVFQLPLGCENILQCFNTLNLGKSRFPSWWSLTVYLQMLLFPFLFGFWRGVWAVSSLARQPCRAALILLSGPVGLRLRLSQKQTGVLRN